jgi:hypothetical protein
MMQLFNILNCYITYEKGWKTIKMKLYDSYLVIKHFIYGPNEQEPVYNEF